MPVKRLSVADLLPATQYYMTYDGSTTFPACHETVTWLILNKPIYITKQQVNDGESNVRALSRQFRRDDSLGPWARALLAPPPPLPVAPALATRRNGSGQTPERFKLFLLLLRLLSNCSVPNHLVVSIFHVSYAHTDGPHNVSHSFLNHLFFGFLFLFSFRCSFSKSILPLSFHLASLHARFRQFDF